MRDKNARCEIKNARCELKNARCEIKNVRCELKNARNATTLGQYSPVRPSSSLSKKLIRYFPALFQTKHIQELLLFMPIHLKRASRSQSVNINRTPLEVNNNNDKSSFFL